MVEQTDMGFVDRPAPESIGRDGKRAWFWQDGSWQVGKAWKIHADGTVVGMCRDYGQWGCGYSGRSPLETHGTWKPHEVSWKKPREQYARPISPQVEPTTYQHRRAA